MGMYIFASSIVTNLASTLLENILQKGNRKVRKRLNEDKRQQAIQRCLQTAIISMVVRARLDEPEQENLLLDIFTKFFDDEDVASEVAKLVNGKSMDMEYLDELFYDAGYDAKTLKGLSFSEAIVAFESTFLEAVETDPVLEPVIKLNQIKEKLTEEQINLGKQIAGEINAENITATNLANIQNFYIQLNALPQTDTSALDIYAEQLRDSLKSATFLSNVSSSDEAPPELSAVYIALNTTTAIHKNEHREGEKEPLTALAAVTANRKIVLLGDPGSGKSTFVNHLVYSLAAHHAAPHGRWLERLSDWSTEEAVIPVLVILRDYARTLPAKPSEKATASDLQNFIKSTLEKDNQSKAWPLIEDALNAGDAMLFFDGLDEVTTTDQRRFVRDAITEFVGCYKKCRSLVTCRILSYQYNPEKAKEDLRLKQYSTFTLADFTREQQLSFIDNWYKELKQKGHLININENVLVENLQKAVKRDDLAEMSGNPLLLTMMAITHKESGLPDSRVDLYQKIVNQLLSEWDKLKSASKESRLTDFLQKDNIQLIALKRVLNAVAYEAHTKGGSSNEATDIDAAYLCRELGTLNKYDTGEGNYEPDEKWGRKLLELLNKRAGLLVERKSGGPFAFPHRTIQEYLAGVYIASVRGGENAQSECASFGDCLLHWANRWANEDGDWQLLILFAVEHSMSTDSPKVADIFELIEALCPEDGEDTTVSWKLAWLAGDIMLNVKAQAKDRVSRFKVQTRVQERLIALLEHEHQPLSLDERVKASIVLSNLGDNRPGVGLNSDGWPDIAWGGIVPEGTYEIGGDSRAYQSFDKGKQAHIKEFLKPAKYSVTNAQFQALIDDTKGQDDASWWKDILGKDFFQLAKYPITNAQFQAFIEDTKEKEDATWWDGVPDKERVFDDSTWTYNNHPRTDVSWYQAMAFCRWLSDKLMEDIRLPHENEWEVAARWNGKDTDGRFYPYDNEFNKDKANTSEGGIGQTTAVGLYPSGKNKALDLYDMSGNVWEWCRNKYNEPEHDMVDKNNDSRALRGGSFIFGQDDARAAARNNHDPSDRPNLIGFRVAVVRRSPSHHDH